MDESLLNDLRRGLSLFTVRAWRLHLTAAAHPLLGKLRLVGEAVVDEALTGVPDAARAALTDGLMQRRANLSSRAPDARVAAGAA